MPINKDHLEELLTFIKEKRSNEINFEQIYDRLNQENAITKSSVGEETYYKNIAEVKNVYAEEYLKSKERTGSAWPEYEKFISAFEKAITGALNGS